MDLNAVADGLAANVENGVDNTAFGLKLTSLPYVPDAIPVPCFTVAEIDVEFDKAFRRSMDEVVIVCRLFTATADDRGGQQNLRAFMSGGGLQSVKQAIESERTLGGACDDLRVRRARGNRLFIVGDNRYYGVEFDVFVIGDGD